MGWFGGEPEGSSAGGTIDMSKFNTDGYGSKMRSSSSYEFDTSADSGGASSFSSSLDSSSGSVSSGQDIQRAVALEQQKLQLMQQLHKVNDVCWDMCVGSPSSSLSGREETCISNCVERFVDTSVLLVNRFSQLAQRMGGGR